MFFEIFFFLQKHLEKSKKESEKMLIVLFFFSFSFFVLFFQCFSSVSCYVKHPLGKLHLSCEVFLFSFLRRALYSTRKKFKFKQKFLTKKLFQKFLDLQLKEPIMKPC